MNPPPYIITQYTNEWRFKTEKGLYVLVNRSKETSLYFYLYLQTTQRYLIPSELIIHKSIDIDKSLFAYIVEIGIEAYLKEINLEVLPDKLYKRFDIKHHKIYRTIHKVKYLIDTSVGYSSGDKTICICGSKRMHPNKLEVRFYKYEDLNNSYNVKNKNKSRYNCLDFEKGIEYHKQLIVNPKVGLMESFL